jgi:hypothetical protein
MVAMPVPVPSAVGTGKGARKPKVAVPKRKRQKGNTRGPKRNEKGCNVVLREGEKEYDAANEGKCKRPHNGLGLCLKHWRQNFGGRSDTLKDRVAAAEADRQKSAKEDEKAAKRKPGRKKKGGLVSKSSGQKKKKKQPARKPGKREQPPAKKARRKDVGKSSGYNLNDKFFRRRVGK